MCIRDRFPSVCTPVFVKHHFKTGLLPHITLCACKSAPNICIGRERVFASCMQRTILKPCICIFLQNTLQNRCNNIPTPVIIRILQHFTKLCCYIGIVDCLSSAKTYQAPFIPLVIRDFILLHTFCQTLGRNPVQYTADQFVYNQVLLIMLEDCLLLSFLPPYIHPVHSIRLDATP